MGRNLGFIIFGFLLVIAGCSKEETGEMVLRFDAQFGSEPLTFLESYPATDEYNLQFTKSDFYISDVTIVTDQGDEILLADIEFIDITEAYGGSVKPIQLEYQDIPQGTYSQLKFGYGVAPTMNSSLPKDWESSHPLSRTSHYWDQWNSYIFSKLEGRLDASGTGTFDTGFIYHTGINEVYRIFEFNAPILIAGDPKEVMIQIDYQKMIAPPNGEALPIIESPINHDPNNIEAFHTITRNFGNAMTLILQ